MKQMKALLDSYILHVKKASDDDVEHSERKNIFPSMHHKLILKADFGTAPPTNTYKAVGSIRRAGTVIRTPLEGRRDRAKDKMTEGGIRASEVGATTVMA